MNLRQSFSIATLALALPANAAEIAVFNFQDAWTGAKNPDFATFAGNATSVDEHTDSTVSELSNSGLTAGGYASFVLSDAVVGTEIFSTSDTTGIGMNFGGANQTEATNYFSFTVSPENGASLSYGSLTLFTSAYGGTDTYNVELRAVIGDGEEQVMGEIHEHVPGGTNNEPVHAVIFDFDDFASSDVTEWRVYIYNTDMAPWAIRFDDVTLLEPDSPIVKPTIKNFSIVDGMLSLTWDSSPDESYTIRYSTDLDTWEGDFDDGLPGAAGDNETTAVYSLELAGVDEEERLFIRVEEE